MEGEITHCSGCYKVGCSETMEYYNMRFYCKECFPKLFKPKGQDKIKVKGVVK